MDIEDSAQVLIIGLRGESFRGLDGQVKGEQNYERERKQLSSVLRNTCFKWMQKEGVPFDRTLNNVSCA
jgi:hypothetical protein